MKAITLLAGTLFFLLLTSPSYAEEPSGLDEVMIKNSVDYFVYSLSTNDGGTLLKFIHPKARPNLTDEINALKDLEIKINNETRITSFEKIADEKIIVEGYIWSKGYYGTRADYYIIFERSGYGWLVTDTNIHQIVQVASATSSLISSLDEEDIDSFLKYISPQTRPNLIEEIGAVKGKKMGIALRGTSVRPIKILENDKIKVEGRVHGYIDRGYYSTSDYYLIFEQSDHQWLITDTNIHLVLQESVFSNIPKSSWYARVVSFLVILGLTVGIIYLLIRKDKNQVRTEVRCAFCNAKVKSIEDLSTGIYSSMMFGPDHSSKKHTPYGLGAFHNECFGKRTKAWFPFFSIPINSVPLTIRSIFMPVIFMPFFALGIIYLQSSFQTGISWFGIIVILLALPVLFIDTAYVLLPLVLRIKSYYRYEKPLKEK